MGTNGVETMMGFQPTIGIKRLKQAESRRWTVYHRSGDRVIEQYHRIVGHAFQEFIEGEDLRPVSILGTGGLVMNSGDRGL